MTVDPRELRALLRGAPPEQVKAVISSLPPDVAERISKDWWFVARDAQLPPPGNWTYWTVLAGRGFGKTRTGTEWVKETARNNPGTVGHLVAPTAGDIERVMLYGPAGLITMAPDDFRPRYIGSKNKLIWPNGTVAFTFSAEEPERLRGPQCLVAETLVAMADGTQKPIVCVKRGDLVKTRKGPRVVTWSGLTHKSAELCSVLLDNGRELVGTEDHPVWIERRGFVEIRDLVKGDLACVIGVSSGEAIAGIPTARTTRERTNLFARRPIAASTGKSMRPTTAQFLRAMTFITRTVTASTTPLRIWKQFQQGNTAAIMRQSMVRRMAGLFCGNSGIAPLSVNALAPDVALSSCPRRSSPDSSADQSALSGGETQAATVLSVTRLAKRQPVYDLTVEDAHEFFANGILVHNCHWAWCDELAAWKRLMETWDQLQFGYRLVPTLGCVVTTTPRPLPVIKELVGKFKAQGFAVVTGGSTYDNKANLSEKFFREVVSKYEGTRLGRQELEAAILDDVPGALWTLTQIDGTRLPEATCDFERVVVAVDPPASSGEDADECGIVVAARGTDKRGYVLADCSSHKETPQQWAARAVKAYHEYKADRIVAEANNGGEMVSAVILQVDPKVPVKLVHASRGKVTRAEPVSALYEQGRVSHVGTFAKLEDQMSAFTLDFDKKKMGYSPDRVDSLVWALTELMLGFIADNSIFPPLQVGAGPNNSLN